MFVANPQRRKTVHVHHLLDDVQVEELAEVPPGDAHSQKRTSPARAANTRSQPKESVVEGRWRQFHVLPTHLRNRRATRDAWGGGRQGFCSFSLKLQIN